MRRDSSKLPRQGLRFIRAVLEDTTVDFDLTLDICDNTPTVKKKSSVEAPEFIKLSHTFVKMASSTVGFLDLPPELRNRIYELVLVARSNGPTVLMPRLRPDLGEIQRGFMSPITFPHQYDRREWNTSDPTSFGLVPSLLATCKQIYQEALPVLYGNNPFLIAADTDEIKYTRREGALELPRAVQAMRIVELHGGKKQVIVKSLLLVLQNMLDLDTLRIDLLLRRNFTLPRTMANGLLPLVQKLHAERMGTDRKQVMDVIEFKGPASEWSRHRDIGFDQELQQIFRRELGLE
ncbi:hypothetical protein CBER1_03750 [Cercospora berteroae]|uniref:Uncharacterized protein n=1 Tax=Cercospora berteroae TaxID=357750 RepID=A0A2S6C7E0_9PEZI|nr:hypothetical protein CBER1_03750 [Cercospora berteroae]